MSDQFKAQGQSAQAASANAQAATQAIQAQIAAEQAASKQRSAEELKKVEQQRSDSLQKAKDVAATIKFQQEQAAKAQTTTGGKMTPLINSLPTTGEYQPTQTILGLPNDTKTFTKFGEAVQKSANLSFANPSTKFGGQ